MYCCNKLRFPCRVMPNEVRRPVKLESFTPVQSKTREKSPVAATSSTTTASITTTATQKSNNHKVESEKVVTSKGTDNHSEEKPTKAPPNSQQPESAVTNGEVLASRLKIETVLRFVCVDSVNSYLQLTLYRRTRWNYLSSVSCPNIATPPPPQLTWITSPITVNGPRYGGYNLVSGYHGKDHTES